MNISHDEMLLVELIDARQGRMNKNAADSDIDLQKFPNAFELFCGHGNVHSTYLKSSLSENDRGKLGQWIFGSYFSRQVNHLSDLVAILKDSPIAAEALVLLLFSFWLNQDPPFSSRLVHFSSLLVAFCSFAGKLPI